MPVSDTWHKEIIEKVRKLHKTQIKWRRHLHRYPELSNEEFDTTAFLRKELKRLKLKLLPLKIKTGVLAKIRGKSGGPTVAIRSDIDAIPVPERTGLPFASKVDGKMHACGHDMHMATVLGVAAILADWRDRLNGNVRFIFQPAEEMPPGGALPMIENGALDGVATIFGLHVDPLVPVGKIGLRDGAAMAWVYDFDLIIRGKSAHVCRPDACVDAIVTAAEVIDSLQKIVSRETDPLSPIVVSIGKIEGGSARNVIADEVRMVGTVRTLSAKMLKRLPRIIRRIVGGVCRARGATFEISDIASYPGLYNDIKTNRLFSHNYESLFGKNRVVEIEPTLGGEDFACYVQKVPGAMFRVGIGNKKIGADKPWHSPEFIADEKSLVHATALLVSSTLDYLDRHKE